MSTQNWVEAKEVEWREALRHASLVAEIDLDDDEVERAERVLGLLLRQNHANAIAKRYPAFFVVALANAGMRCWEDGTFYKKVADALSVKKPHVEDAARAFPEGIRRCQLPSFSEAGGMTWVTPVLLHGAVPLDHLDELLDLLKRRRRHDPSLTAESFVEWVRVSPAALAAEPKAMTRFLERGGDFASDYVSRIMDLVDGRDVVLPRRVIERVRELMAGNEDLYRSRISREARPVVARRADGTIILRLPGVRPADGRTARWDVTVGERVHKLEADIPYGSLRGVSGAQTLELGQPVRSIRVERPTGTTEIPFVRKEDPLLIFDANGDLVAPTQAVPRGRATLMWPSVGEETPAPVDHLGIPIKGDERQPPYGWEKWRVLVVELRDARTVQLGRGPRRIVAGADRPQIITGEPVPYVATNDGREILAELPQVQLPVDSEPSDWHVLVTDSDAKVLESVRPTTSRFAVLPGSGGAISGELTVEVRGPLGRSARRTFAVVEGLSVESTPRYRNLDPAGGLEPATITLSTRESLRVTVVLDRNQSSFDYETPGLVLVVEPPHLAFRAFEQSSETPWVTSPLVIPARDIANWTFQVTGWEKSQRPMLILRAGDLDQRIPATTFRGTNASFDLAALTSTIASEGAGTLLLGVEPPVRVASIKPATLAESLVRVSARLLVGTDVSVPLQAIVYRSWAPWSDPAILDFTDHTAILPSSFRNGGELRVRIRERDDWGAEPPGPIPRLDKGDVFQIEGEWSPSSDDPDVRAVVRVLAGLGRDNSENVTSTTTARVFEALQVDESLQIPSFPRRALLGILKDHPNESLLGTLETAAAANTITVGLVESGVVWTPVSAFDRSLDAIRLAQRSPLAAALAASNRIRWGSSQLELELSEILGDDVLKLARGEDDAYSQGQFETWYLDRPQAVEFAYSLLNPVPNLPVDPDSRIAASMAMWRSRARLSHVSKYAMGNISAVREVLRAEGAAKLWALIEARLSQDGLLALPPLSIALGIASRLAAHGSGNARKLVEHHHSVYPQLVRWAPTLTSIDLIRADAAVRSRFS